MLLSARVLQDVANANSFEYGSEICWTEGDTLNIYFQLIDASLDTPLQGFSPAGRRFVPATGATLEITLENLDDGKKLTRLATQPFANDGSIWALQVLASDKIRGTPQARFKLTQSTVVTTGLLKNGIKIYPKTNC
jgi:hypothetical protein